MIKWIFLALSALLLSFQIAEAQFPAVRNDSATTVLIPTNGDPGPIAVSSTGRLFFTAGTGALDLGKAEDAAHTTGDLGILILGRRIDTLASSATTSGDYATVNLDSVGALWTTPGTRDATWAHAAYANGSITASYTTAVTNSALIKFCKIWNQTDAGVIISFDATNDHIELAAGATEIYDFGVNGRHISSNISAKRLSGAPTTGTLYIDCFS